MYKFCKISVHRISKLRSSRTGSCHSQDKKASRSIFTSVCAPVVLGTTIGWHARAAVQIARGCAALPVPRTDTCVPVPSDYAAMGMAQLSSKDQNALKNLCEVLGASFGGRMDPPPPRLQHACSAETLVQHGLSFLRVCGPADCPHAVVQVCARHAMDALRSRTCVWWSLTP